MELLESVTPEKIHELFGNIEEIYAFHTEFLKKMEVRLFIYFII